MGGIIIANKNLDSARKIGSVLKAYGLPVTAVCSTGSRLLELARRVQCGVIIATLDLQDMPAQNLPRVVAGTFDFIYIARPHQSIIVESLDHLCLNMPLNKLDLFSTAKMALSIEAPSESKIKKVLENGEIDGQAVIEKAKKKLMDRNYFTEAQAHRYLQKRSMDTCKKMTEIALIVLKY